MTKQEVCRALEKTSGTTAFITATQLTKAMGMKTSDYVKKRYLDGLECIDGKYYFVPDVAAVIMSRKGKGR